MKVITLYIDAARTMEIVRELRQQGMKQGKDFDFSYNRSSDNFWDDEYDIKPHAAFKFYIDKYATFFALKYSI